MNLESTLTPSLSTELLERIEARTARVAIVGLGYVGLPLAESFAWDGFPVLGFDIDAREVEMLIPSLPPMRHHSIQMDSQPLTEPFLQHLDCVVVTDHSSYDYDWIVKHAPLVVDTRNATAG